MRLCMRWILFGLAYSSFYPPTSMAAAATALTQVLGLTFVQRQSERACVARGITTIAFPSFFEQLRGGKLAMTGNGVIRFFWIVVTDPSTFSVRSKRSCKAVRLREKPLLPTKLSVTPLLGRGDCSAPRQQSCGALFLTHYISAYLS